MGENKDATISLIFKLMTEWKELPNYQLERRADIFFAYYLPDIMNYYFNEKRKNNEYNEVREITDSDIIPEFPIRIGNDENGYGGSNHSFKIDYAVFGEKNIYFVELKTDMASLDRKQISNLKKASVRKVNDLKLQLSQIYKGSDHKDKYVVLNKRLRDNGIGFSIESKNLKHEIEKFYDTPHEIIYILPERPDKYQELCKEYPSKYRKISKDVIEGLSSLEPDYITFSEVRDCLAGKQDGISEHFRCSLSKWMVKEDTCE